MRWRRSDAGRRVKLTDIVSRDVSVLTVEGAHNQIPDMGRRRDSQVANMEHVQKVRKCVQLWKALWSRKLMALLRSGGRSDDLRATRGPASVVELLENDFKPGAIILNCGAMSNKVLHVRPSVCIIRRSFRRHGR